MKFYRHLTSEERICLQKYYENGFSIRKIAKYMARSPSTISRELKKYKAKDGTYNYYRAHSVIRYKQKNRKIKHRILDDAPLTQFIIEKLQVFWSPEIIALKWKEQNPTCKISHVTIYKAIKTGLLCDVSVTKNLRRRGKKKYSRKDGKYNTITPDYLIGDWASEIINRETIGHLEGDTVRGGLGKGGITTLVCRKSRFLFASLICNFSSLEVKNALLSSVKGHPIKSFSLDNGSEFALHKEISNELGIKIYFAKPHSPWERGTNENTNSLLRFFFPKGYNFHNLQQDELDYVVNLLNDRPRKCLGLATPREIWSGCCT